MAQEDRRELILVALRTALEGEFGAKSTFRNRKELPEDNLPAAVMMDGDEMRSQGGRDATGRQRPINGPQMVDMTPELILIAQENTAVIGTSVNDLRRRALKAITNSQTLAALIHEFRYEGMTTTLAEGRTVNGQVNLNLTFVYHLRMDQL